MIHTAVRCLPAVLLAAAAALPAGAQERPGSDARRRPPATAEVRAGIDYRSEAPLVGGALRFPVFGARGDLVAGGEAVFRSGLTETEGHVDALVALGGRGAVVLGGGPAVLSSIFPDEEARETRWGYSVVAGLRQLPGVDDVVGFTLELRWVFVDDLRPRTLTLGVGLPLFGMPF